VFTFPGLEEVDSVELPAQQQGEGISVAPDGTVYASSEGVRSPLLRIAVPSPTPSPSPTPPPTPTPSPSATPDPDPSVATEDDAEPDPRPWVIGGLVALVGLIVLVRALRPN
jgi:cell division septation protein DedD